MKETLDVHRNIEQIIHGAARGADTLAGRYGLEAQIPVIEFPADWAGQGRRAGPIRNGKMLREGKPEYVIAFLGPGSRGTKNMISIAEKAGIPVEIVNI